MTDFRRRLRYASAALTWMALSCVAWGSDTFAAPVAEELKMTAVPGFPGVAAVVLHSEQITKDSNLTVTHYERIKVLTEEGKKYANVEVGFVSTPFFSRFGNDRVKVKEIAGRTIHSDGTIVDLSEEAHEQTREEVKGVKIQVKVFTLPAVEVGSILEYRYTTQSTGYDVPEWDVQGDLYVLSAHYEWHRSSVPVIGDERKRLTTVSYYSILPTGAQVEEVKKQKDYQLDVKDIPPFVKEDYSPPLSTFVYRVLFSFTPYKTKDEFWQKEGKEWSKDEEKFIGPVDDLMPQTNKVIAGAKTDEERLRKIYAEVMQLENTYYSRKRERREDKAEGLGAVRSAADVLTHRRGTPTELTELFLGMARAAGMQAYEMLVPDRSESWFVEDWLNAHQFDAAVALVKVDGKEEVFDPGSRFCPYGKLSWWHMGVEGLRQTETGTAFYKTSDPDTSNSEVRVAEFQLDDSGEITGKLNVTYTGAPALHLRHVALQGDDTSFRTYLQKDVQTEMPTALEAKVVEVKDLDNYEQPLVVTYAVSGKAANAAGRRLVLPVALLEAGSDAFFPHEERNTAVAFDYPEHVQDTLHIALPKSMVLEAQPEKTDLPFTNAGEYTLSTSSAGNAIEVRRDFRFDAVLVPVSEYSQLRAFYTQLQGKDHDSLLFKMQLGIAETQAR